MGALIRRIGIAAREGEARAVVEDDFHHFRVTVEHDGRRVTRAFSEAVRHPWTACALAGDRLSELVGMELSPRASAVLAYTEQRLQCTHMFDLAGLAIAAAARGIQCRTYQAVVPDRVAGATKPSLERDNELVFSWDLEGSNILGPVPFSGVNLQAGFSRWVDDNLDIEAAEAALVLRRAVFISGGRGIDLDRAVMAPARGGCFVQQPERAATARRVIGSTMDFTDRADALLRSDADWLAFAAPPPP